MTGDTKKPAPFYTTSNGRPITNPFSSERVGANGPILLQDFHLIDLLAHFDRERIPERVVHAKGGGAFGEFEVTDDITDVVSEPSDNLDAVLTNGISRRQRIFSPMSERRHLLLFALARWEGKRGLRTLHGILAVLRSNSTPKRATSIW